MKRMNLILLLIAPIFVTFHVLGQEAQIMVHVTDENGLVISNAQVSVGFMKAVKPGDGWGIGGENNIKGTTDADGLYSASGQTTSGSIGISVRKDGYYGSVGQSMTLKHLDLTGRWEPWNPIIDVVLKKKGIQVPMYALRAYEIKIPVKGEALGFDLIAADWVAPYGKGDRPDFLIDVESKTNHEYPYYDVTLTVGFSNDGDGIQSFIAARRGTSELRLPRQAPLDGFKSVLKKRDYREPSGSQTDFRDDQNYFFRVRTQKDAHGNIVSTLYGKISGDFLVSGSDDDKLTFTYYLNPQPDDRNMEFNPKQNLFKNLPPLERVNAP